MKKFIEKFLPWIIIGCMLLSLVPSLYKRFTNEGMNNKVELSLLYNDLRNNVSPSALPQILDEYKKMGVNTVSIVEDDINAMVSRGELTAIKYNVLMHKYDDESMRIARHIEENYPSVAYDSLLIMVKKEEARKKLSKLFPLRFSEDEYVKIENIEGMDIYAYFDGRSELWDIALGYDEKVISDLSEKGFNIALVYKVKNYSNLSYIDYIEKIVKDYNVKYLNLKKASREYDEDEVNKDNYKWIAPLINENDMCLVVTENTDQLSNQKFLGFNEIFASVMLEGGSKKVLRSYETYDDTQKDESNYKYRTNQYFNSSVDRNIRFITITQIEVEDHPYSECAVFTLKAVNEYIEKAKDNGFSFEGEVTPYDNYGTNVRFASMASLVIMVMLMLISLEILMGKKKLSYTVIALIVSFLGALATFVMPLNLVLLYPTFYNLVVSCFGMTYFIFFVNKYKEKFNTISLIALSALVLLVILSLGALGMGAMLSGIDYYLNNLIFRGIKLSLIVPLLYTAIAYYIIVLKKEDESYKEAAKKFLLSDIKVYFVIIGAFALLVLAYYLLRSGNVNKISTLEQTMRTTITDLFPERPRTKEFLIGYPALALFVFYMKNSDIKLVQWFTAIGASILSASVMNSFCHVFTDLSVIYMRVINGVLIGTIAIIIACLVNFVLVKIIKKVLPETDKLFRR